jgi:hypothetical protein
MTTDLGGLDVHDPRCSVVMGAPGDDSRRCERDALPLHRTHLIKGIYYMPDNTDDLNNALHLVYDLEGMLA